MKTKVVNLIAAPGVGKSTCAALIFGELKSKHLTCEVVPEYAKWLIYKGRADELNNQYQVSMKQYKLIKTLENKVEFIICDSLLLGLYYNRMYKTNVSNVKRTEEMILQKLKEFDHNIYIFLERNPEHPYEKQGRVHSEVDSIHIHMKMKELLNELGIKYFSIVSDKKSIEPIIEYICNN